MDDHFLGKGSPSEDGSEKMGERDSTASTHGTSLAVRQFCAFAFGWSPVHLPSQPWRVERVVFDERYCLKCYGLRGHDVIYEFKGMRSVSFCRCCGEEVRYG